jgi:hypothetical protein
MRDSTEIKKRVRQVALASNRRRLLMKIVIAALAAITLVASPAFAETANLNVKHVKQVRHAPLKEGRYSADERTSNASLIEQGYSDWWPKGPGMFH